MPRNGSGTATIPNSFTPSTTISSSAVNANFADVAAELTNSVAVDGQSTMTGALKAAPGAALTPSVTFGADTDTGLYRKGANQLGAATGGVERGYFDTTGALVLLFGATITGAVTIGGNTADAFPTGTKMTFQQTAAPTGWTKDTTHNDKTFRVVSGAASSGGTIAFSTAFAGLVAGTVGNTALTVPQLPVHSHTMSGIFSQDGSSTNGSPDFFMRDGLNNGNYSDTGVIENTGSGATHTHTFTGTSNINVLYVDLILATKN